MAKANRMKNSLLILLFMMGCQNPQMTPESYVSLVNDKKAGYVQTEEIGDFSFTAQYRSSAFLAISEIGLTNINQENYDSCLKKKDGLISILFQFGCKNKTDDPLEIISANKQEYQQRLMYLMDQVKNDFYLVDNKDTLFCKMHHFERSYHLTGHHTVLLFFERNSVNKESDLKLVYDDFVMSKGKVQFNFDNELVNSIPQIIF